ncbi:MAG TPA: adenylate/guanylate cyclase domain-containing protein [Alphaproteobacteria bacterium]
MAEERAQRRLAAILAADVAGYSRLMGEDEEGTLAALKAHRRELIDPKVAEHRGRIVKTTGDGALVEFASVVEAVSCAVEIQHAMAERNAAVPAGRRIAFRVGIHVGDIILDGDDIYGDGVNVAARLEGLAEPGGTCVSEDVYRQVRGKLDVAISGGERQALKNIAEPVRVYRIAAPGRAGTAGPRSRALRGRRTVLYAGLALAAIALVAAGIWFGPNLPGGRPTATRPGDPLPIVAVLPFDNQTGDEGQAYLADGITEDVIDGLGRFGTIRLIGRNAVMAYKNRPATQRDVASQFGASYVVQGSVRRAERGLRVAAQMTDARDSTVLWSNRYEGETSDVFQFQDSITREIVGTLAARIANMETVRLGDERRPQHDAYDLALRARAVGHDRSRTANRRFRELIAAAIEKDANFATAHALMADALHSQTILGWSEFPTDTLRRGEMYARRAIALAPDRADGYRALGRILDGLGDDAQAQSELRRAIELNPSDATALAMWGVFEGYRGDLAAAVDALERAHKYDPMLDPSYVFFLALNYTLAGRHEDAVRAAERGLALYPDFAMFHVPAAAAAGQLGRTELAQRHATEVRQRLPHLDLAGLGSRYNDASRAAYLRDGLTRAGLLPASDASGPVR